MSKIRRIIEIDKNVYEAIKIDNYPVCCSENIILVDAIKNSDPYEERPKGKWEVTWCKDPLGRWGSFYEHKCSVCHKSYIDFTSNSEDIFCRFCGTDMRGEKDGLCSAAALLADEGDTEE